MVVSFQLGSLYYGLYVVAFVCMYCGVCPYMHCYCCLFIGPRFEKALFMLLFYVIFVLLFMYYKPMFQLVGFLMFSGWSAHCCFCVAV